VSLTFLLGGARSGKSSLATKLALDQGRPVTVIATAEARDDEMAERIRLHREERPEGWSTIEEPVALDEALRRVPAGDAVVLDCLSLWVANLLERKEDVDVHNERALTLVQARPAPTIVVSNEVGLGVVPASELGRRYRDLLGRVNARWAAAADEAAFVVAGRALPLQ
jgi:adenosyl cobinamide kinase/adenosyl cobinamide phosphate guanylyltransferase